MNTNRSGPYIGEPLFQLSHPDPWEAIETEKPAFILFYKNGVCCVMVGTREEAHMDLSSVVLKYSIDIHDYSAYSWMLKPKENA
tara:strand:+ start:7625 stop:7876 length:252 start_codon:yes stop_codon:yes gene_type:complete